MCRNGLPDAPKLLATHGAGTKPATVHTDTAGALGSARTVLQVLPGSARWTMADTAVGKVVIPLEEARSQSLSTGKHRTVGRFTERHGPTELGVALLANLRPASPKYAAHPGACPGAAPSVAMVDQTVRKQPRTS